MKHRKSILYSGGLLVLPLILVVFMLASADSTPSTLAATNKASVNAQSVAPRVGSSKVPAFTIVPPTIPANAAKSSQVKGVSAIKIMNTTGTINNNNASSNGAKFTEADVRQFLNNQPQWGLIKSITPFTVEKVEFLTAREVKAHLNQDIAATLGVSDTTILCLVTAHGSFVVAGGPPISGQSSNASNTGATFKRAYQLYDAQTGNLLMMGGLGN
jgi:hypothetical protein